MKAHHKFDNGTSEEVVDINDSDEYVGETNLGISKCQYFLRLPGDHMTFTDNSCHEQMSEFILFLFWFLDVSSEFFF